MNCLAVNSITRSYDQIFYKKYYNIYFMLRKIGTANFDNHTGSAHQSFIKLMSHIKPNWKEFTYSGVVSSNWEKSLFLLYQGIQQSTHTLMYDCKESTMHVRERDRDREISRWIGLCYAVHKTNDQAKRAEYNVDRIRAPWFRELQM